MTGRKDADKKKRTYDEPRYKDYHPNYESTKPHIPCFMFKNILDEKKNKKYKIGKLIRSYNFDPYRYYAMETNQNKNLNEISNISISHNKNNEIKGYNYK